MDLLTHRKAQMTRMNATVAELEQLVGEQVRDARIARDLNQASLAQLANVSVGALSSLERGKGSSLSTFVAVVRALGRTDWLESLAPAAAVSPMHMLRAKRRTTKRLRVRARQARGDASAAVDRGA
jgi:transcriptional regulator with XRE-family HTH domain